MWENAGTLMRWNIYEGDDKSGDKATIINICGLLSSGIPSGELQYFVFIVECIDALYVGLANMECKCLQVFNVIKCIHVTREENK